MSQPPTILGAALALWLSSPASVSIAQEAHPQPDIDARVQQFLDAQRGRWRDANVPESDGRALYDLVVSNGFTRAVEIGTSTGHSGLCGSPGR